MNSAALSLAIAILVFAGCAPSGRSHRAAPGAVAIGVPGPAAAVPAQPGTIQRRRSDAYYLATCARCDGLLGARGDTIDRERDGRDLRFCREECSERFERDPAASLARLDVLMIADQRSLYPLQTSIVSGLDLGARPIDFIFGNRLFRVASHAERDEVLAVPEGYFQILDEAVIAAQEPTYGMPTKCPVQGDILASDAPMDIVVANRMIRVCCARCARVVRSRPSQYLAMVEYANRAAAEPEHTAPRQE